MEGNLFSYIALFSFPVVAAVVFRFFGVVQAVTLTILMGYMFLPVKVVVDYPLLPPFDKDFIPSFMAGLLAFFALKAEKRRSLWNQDLHGSATTLDLKYDGKAGWLNVYTILLMLLVLSCFGTVFTNSDWLIIGPRSLRGLELYDAFSLTLQTVVEVIPFLLGYILFRKTKDVALLIKFIALAGLVYTPLVLLEIRLSPQLHTWIYGFFPHSFAQHVRDGGFRAVVFMGHGLPVSLFLGLSCIACAVIARLPGTVNRTKWYAATAYLMVILVLQKTFLGVIVAGFGIILLHATSLWLRRSICAAVAIFVLAFPMFRAADLVPTERILSMAGNLSAERAESLQFRFLHEDRLLEKANQKPLFGWGTWGRNRIYDENSGADLSVTDGRWVIDFGTRGWIGYIAVFGLLSIPAIRARSQRKKLRSPDLSTELTTGLTILVCANLIDLIPNASLTPVSWLMAGALAAQTLGVQRHSPHKEDAKPTLEADKIDPFTGRPTLN